MKTMQSLRIPFLLFAGSLFLGSCERDGSAEDAGERIDEKMEAAGDRIDNSADKAEDKIDDATN